MEQNQVIIDSLHKELSQFNICLREALKSDNNRINEIVNHAFKVEGKRIRPMLVFLVAKSCGKINQATYHGAATVELLHTATLMHDDVVDESAMRRGQPSANMVFDNKRSILTGDYVLSSALLESVKTENIEIVEIIAGLGKNLSEGELNQYSLVNELVVDEEEYFRVIELKTASLLEACAKIGAITAGADKNTVYEFGRIGHLLGLAFQLRDDIFDYFNSDVGKPTGNDIREGKITLPLIYALRNAPKAISEEMVSIIRSSDFTPENIEKLLSFAKENGGIDYTQDAIDRYLEEAKKNIDRITLNDEIKPALHQLIAFLSNREY